MIALTAVAYRINAIDASGVIAAVPVGFLTLYFGGVTWFLALLSFFLIASYYTRHKYEQKELAGFSEKNRGARGWASVLANGGLPAFFAIMYHFTGNDNLYLLFFSGSLSFALADTIATEIGLLSRSAPRSILSGKHIARGHSGGVTLRGEMAAIAGTLVIGVICGLFFSKDEGQFAIILIACITSGLLSTNLDSVLGESLQCKYRCTVCNKYAESRIVHCDVVTIQHKGLRFIDNNAVNVISSLFGAAICSIFILAFNT
jgi:uncharacterized protein (TIGR00297 family)